MAQQYRLTVDAHDTRDMDEIIPPESEFDAWCARQNPMIDAVHPVDALEDWLRTYEPRAEVVARDYPQATGVWVNLPDSAGTLSTHLAPSWLRRRARRQYV